PKQHPRISIPIPALTILFSHGLLLHLFFQEKICSIFLNLYTPLLNQSAKVSFVILYTVNMICAIFFVKNSFFFIHFFTQDIIEYRKNSFFFIHFFTQDIIEYRSLFDNFYSRKKYP
ncbi:hypothetical protein DW054_15930, partial [Dorea formicigenerans]